jgi:hypothetical protein
MAQATAVVMVAMVAATAAMPVSTAVTIARRHAATTTRLLVLRVNLTMRRVQHLLIALIAATVAPHLHAHSPAKSVVALRIARRVSIPVAMIAASRVQTRVATTVVLRSVVIVAVQRTAVSVHRVLNLHRVLMRASQAVKTVAQPLVTARRVRSRIVNRAHSAVTAITVRLAIVLPARSVATVSPVHLARVTNAHLALRPADVLSTRHAHVLIVSRVIVRHVPNTHRAPSAQTSRHAQSSPRHAQSVTLVTNSAPLVAVIAQSARQ